ncbi:transglutaminase-like cysteine peptidase [Bradyrhizobium sp.]|uniref:transglutaminase-like cysteine peptidase n=1 Tax=Bradyrhizobium sp. TaxID=376 RepID=UPI002D80B723|nr:transglutaminase-like cysteine peptidase [Bradyrhizobium sp.]
MQNRSAADFAACTRWAVLLGFALGFVLTGAMLERSRLSHQLAILGFLTADSLSSAIDGHASATRDENSAEPFGMDTEPVLGGALHEQWHRVKADIGRDREAVAQCRTNHSCSSPAQKLIDLSREGAGRNGRAQVGLINRAVDLAIKPVSDERQWGIPDRWSDPFETLLSERGDCEDYAILKYTALLEAGFPKEALKIVVWRNRLPDEDHAVLAVRIDHQWLILDNRTLTLVRDIDVTRAVPKFVLDERGVRRLVSNRVQKAPA